MKGIAVLLAVAGLALPWGAWAQVPTYDVTQSRFAGDEAGDWGGKKGAVIGPPDGTCANMGARGKVNLIHNFGFDLDEDVVAITAVRFRAKAAAAAGQSVEIQVCPDITDLNGDDNCVGALEVLPNVPVAVGGSGNCDATALTDYVELDESKLTKLILEDHNFGLAFRKIETSEVKVDSICLEVEYTTTDGEAEDLACFEAPPEGTLTMQKTLDANGGSAVIGDWTLTATGDATTGDTVISGPSGTSDTAPAGVYTLTESGPAGYQLVENGINCIITGNGTFTPPNTLTLEESASATCGFENEGIRPTLTVIKTVDNAWGGSAVPGNWTMVVTATNPSDDEFPGEAGPGTDITLDAGAYSVDETGPGGYQKSLGANCSGTLALDSSATCTITNTENEPPPPPPPAPTPVPTLGQWALILLAMLVLGFGLYARRNSSQQR